MLLELLTSTALAAYSAKTYLDIRKRYPELTDAAKIVSRVKSEIKTLIMQRSRKDVASVCPVDDTSIQSVFTNASEDEKRTIVEIFTKYGGATKTT